MGAGLLGFAALPLGAQRSSGPTLSDSLSTITADTGAMAFRDPGRVRYAGPGLCREAALTTNYHLGRTLAARAASARAVRLDPMHDTLPTAGIAAARACGARFTVANTSVQELPDLLDLALLEANDTLALATLRRQAELAPAGSRPAVWVDGITKLLAAKPARVATATIAAAQLDALGESAVAERVAAHGKLLDFAERTFDQAKIRQEAEYILTVVHSLKGAALMTVGGQMYEAYRALMSVAFFNAPDSMPAIAQRAQPDLSRVPAPMGQSNGFMGATHDFVMQSLSPVGDWKQIGHMTPPLKADFWFPIDKTAPDTVQPAPGKVSLFVDIPSGCLNDLMSILIYYSCTDNFESVREWYSQYAAAGLTITLVAGTSGNSILSGPQTPAEEAANIDWYVHQYLHLPVGLAVQHIRFGPPLPDPDGRFMDKEPNPFFTAYGVNSQGSVSVVLTGRDGKEVYAGNVSPIFEKVLTRMMTGPTFAMPVPSSASTSTSVQGTP